MPSFKAEPAVFTGSDKRIRYDSMGVSEIWLVELVLISQAIYMKEI